MAKKEEKFNYCIARYWPGTKALCVYAYGSEVHYGTQVDAERLLDYVNGKSDEVYEIHKIV